MEALAVLGKLGLAVNILFTVLTVIVAILPKRPVFLMRTWAHSWVEPGRWLLAARGWIDFYLRSRRHRLKRLPPDSWDSLIASHDISDPCEELHELAARVGRAAALLAATAEDLDAADLATLRAAVHHLDAAGRDIGTAVSAARRRQAG